MPEVISDDQLRALALSAITGDTDSLNMLLKHSERITRDHICKSMPRLAAEHGFDEVVQATLLSVQKVLQKLANETGSQRGLICSITKYRVRDFYRSRSTNARAQSLNVADAVPSPGNHIKEVIGQELVQQFRERLTLEERLLLELRISGWTMEEIAEELGRHKGTISRWLEKLALKAKTHFHDFPRKQDR